MPPEISTSSALDHLRPKLFTLQPLWRSTAMADQPRFLESVIADSLSHGDTGIAVEEVQHFLRRFGYLEADAAPGDRLARFRDRALPRATIGVMDDATTAAIRNYQRMFRLPATGVIDAATLASMRSPRCGVPDQPSRLFLRALQFTTNGSRWQNTNVSFRFTNFTGDLTQAQVRTAVRNAFNSWSAVTPLRFTEVATGGDILIAFAVGNHGDGAANAFDGSGGVLAHAYPPGGGIGGDVHFDDAETWTIAVPTPTNSFDLETVALHEIGHALGLGHSLDVNSVMFANYSGQRRDLRFDDIDGIRSVYGSNSTDIKPIPGWFGAEDQGGDVAISDISGNGRPDIIVFHIDNPGGDNHGYYRIGWNLDRNGNVTGGWSPIMPVPGWFGAENQGAGIAIADISGNGRPDLVVFHIDNPGGENHGYYRIGWNLDVNGNVTGGWSPVMPVPGWFGAEDQGAGIAIGDIDGNGRPELIVFHIDNPGGENHGYYRIGWNLSATGAVTGGWSPIKAIPGWFGAEDQGAGIALADTNGNGRNDLVVFHLDNPGGENHGYFRIGRDLSAAGDVANWGPIVQIPGWFGAENQGAGIAASDINGDGIADLVVFHVDNPSGENHGYYRCVMRL
jgi:hypothetical protein